MSESETASQSTPEEAQEPLSEGSCFSASIPAGNDQHHTSSPSRQPIPSPSSLATAEIASPGQRAGAHDPASNTHHDLNQILARAREEIRRLREELAKHEAQASQIAKERDEVRQQYMSLYDNFLETVHIAAEEEIRQTAYNLRATPGRIPKRFEPLQESITSWVDRQQAERETVLRQKLETVEQQAEAIRQELMREQETLNVEREKIAQDRQALNVQIKTREMWLKNRWFARAWATSSLMFLILPALQIYLLAQKADSWNLIIIPTTICLILTGLISFARSRRRPAPQKR